MTTFEIAGLLTIAALLGVVIAFANWTAPAPQPKENRMKRLQTQTIATKKQSSSRASTIAAKVMGDRAFVPTPAEIRTLAASVLAQDETRGGAAASKKRTGAR